MADVAPGKPVARPPFAETGVTDVTDNHAGPAWRHMPIDVVDTQVHLDMPPDQALACMDAAGISSMLIDEFWRQRDDRGNPLPGHLLAGDIFRPISPLGQLASLAHPARFSTLVRVDRADPQVEAILAIAGSTPFVRALRVSVGRESERAAFARGDHMPLFAGAARYGLPVFVHLHPMESDYGPLWLERYLTAFPDLTMIIDHCGSPLRPEQYEATLRLARFGNCMLKWCHAPSYFYRWLDTGSAPPTYPFPELIKELRRALDAFGRERIMWASDYTMNDVGLSWAEILGYIRDAADLSTDDKAWILGNSARRVLNWSSR